ncbi:MAG: hypothetical protein KGM43_03275 [Planctomycetota bacterium]|nr:hypothetical protein [Planctomycetota bacterium]
MSMPGKVGRDVTPITIAEHPSQPPEMPGPIEATPAWKTALFALGAVLLTLGIGRAPWTRRGGGLSA